MKYVPLHLWCSDHTSLQHTQQPVKDPAKQQIHWKIEEVEQFPNDELRHLSNLKKLKICCMKD
jgi:hypothetical protein